MVRHYGLFDQEDYPVPLLEESSISTASSSETVLMVEDEPETVLMVKPDQGDPVTISTQRRGKGLRTGRIQWRTVTKKNGKQYQQAWYDWQTTEDGKTKGKSAYIPKRLLASVQALEAAKAPVQEVLRVLAVGKQGARKSKSPTKRRGKNKLPASGHISPTIQRKNGKEYPVVTGERVPCDLAWDYPEQFVWLYNWGVTDADGCWKNRSRRVPVSKIYSVRSAIAANKPVEEILHLIEQP